MDVTEALRTTGSIRDFTGELVSDEVIYAILDDARFAPSGGNRQAWRVIVVTGEQRRRLRDIYVEGWHEYVAHVLAGLVPFSPLASPADRAAAIAQREKAVSLSDPEGFAENIDRVPVMLVVLADLEVLAATDRDLDRYQFVGGASIYPFVWSVLLAAHERGVGGVMTTVAIAKEAALRDVLTIPEHFAVASVVALGFPASRHTKLTRRPVEAFTTIDRLDGTAFFS
jgi:nitroreductase